LIQIAKPVADLIAEFEKLPGIGPKSAQRLVYHLLHAPRENSDQLARAVSELKIKTKICGICGNVAESDPCGICSEAGRDHTVVMVVEEPLDVLAIERTRAFNGVYQVLHGAISPLSNIGPEDLKIQDLLSRLKDGQVKEVILATNPNMEGEATAMYVQKLVSPIGLKITRLARGLPVGGDLEYADEVTLTRALEGRTVY
jgi:recombination protein RecR